MRYLLFGITPLLVLSSAIAAESSEVVVSGDVSVVDFFRDNKRLDYDNSEDKSQIDALIKDLNRERTKLKAAARGRALKEAQAKPDRIELQSDFYEQLSGDNSTKAILKSGLITDSEAPKQLESLVAAGVGTSKLSKLEEIILKAANGEKDASVRVGGQGAYELVAKAESINTEKTVAKVGLQLRINEVELRKNSKVAKLLDKAGITQADLDTFAQENLASGMESSLDVTVNPVVDPKDSKLTASLTLKDKEATLRELTAQSKKFVGEEFVKDVNDGAFDDIDESLKEALSVAKRDLTKMQQPFDKTDKGKELAAKLAIAKYMQDNDVAKDADLCSILEKAGVEYDDYPESATKKCEDPKASEIAEKTAKEAEAKSLSAEEDKQKILKSLAGVGAIGRGRINTSQEKCGPDRAAAAITSMAQPVQETVRSISDFMTMAGMNVRISDPCSMALVELETFKKKYMVVDPDPLAIFNFISESELNKITAGIAESFNGPTVGKEIEDQLSETRSSITALQRSADMLAAQQMQQGMPWVSPFDSQDPNQRRKAAQMLMCKRVADSLAARYSTLRASGAAVYDIRGTAGGFGVPVNPGSAQGVLGAGTGAGGTPVVGSPSRNGGPQRLPAPAKRRNLIRQ